ncbi:hypothetical protein BpHYR1_054517 [Brachionus plicatilis]|uniref:Uncharacterized protein n=1 Tax=Brachionus plicatilis TaxID=10195 RepID=A0A3M7S2G4_BRAPC|nr:hypothetical protein BpHYR1_054517 [Brachionus plicatilis]
MNQVVYYTINANFFTFSQYVVTQFLSEIYVLITFDMNRITIFLIIIIIIYFKNYAKFGEDLESNCMKINSAEEAPFQSLSSVSVPTKL